MIVHRFKYKTIMFGIERIDGVMINKDDTSARTTIYNLYAHEQHIDISDSVPRDGIWAKIDTISKEMVSESQDVQSSNVKFNHVEQYIQSDDYSDIIRDI